MPGSKLRPAAIVSLLLIAAVMQGCTNTKQEEYITIGALLPLTGEDSDEGLRALNGLQVAKDEINESGGILGKKLDIIALNDRGDEAFVVQQYEALMKKGVSAIIGSSYSVVTMALAQAGEKDGIPIISPTASNPEVTRGRRNVFRAIFTDDYQAEVMAHFAYNSLGARTALVLSNLSYGNFRQTAEVFAESFRALGGQIRSIESYSSEQPLADILTRYRANPPDAIFCPENYVPAVKLVNTAYNIGLRDTYILGTDAWDGLLAYVVQHETVNNVYYSAPFSFDDNNEQVAAFVRNYFNSFSQMPLSGSATAYTCVYILAQAFTTAGNTNRDDVIAAMKTNELDMITGHIQFDENNNPRTNVYIIQVKDGAYSAYEKLSLQRGQ